MQLHHTVPCKFISVSHDRIIVSGNYITLIYQVPAGLQNTESGTSLLESYARGDRLLSSDRQSAAGAAAFPDATCCSRA